MISLHREPERLTRNRFLPVGFSYIGAILRSIHLTCATFAGLLFETIGEVYL
jgi:hypothetical protein